MKAQRFLRMGMAGQAGWALPLMLVLGAILLLLSGGLYFILSKELKMNAASVTSDHTFSGGDAALNRASTWLEANWNSYGESNGGSRYDSLTTTPFTDIPGIAYNISITPGALTITFTTSAYVPVSLWAQVGDLNWDRTIFVKVTDLSATNNALATKYYYTTVHRDSQCRPQFADPLVATGNISMGATDQGSCYTLANLQSGNTLTSCAIAHQVAGGQVTTPVSCFTPVNGYPICSVVNALPTFACPLPGFVNVTDNFFFPTPTITPQFSATSTVTTGASGPTSTFTPTPTPTTPSTWPTNMPSFCYAVQALCGGYIVDSGATIDSYPTTGHGGLSVSGGGITNNGGTVTGVTSVATACVSNATCVPTPAGLTIYPSANLFVQNCAMTLTLAAGDYSNATSNTGGCYQGQSAGEVGTNHSGVVIYLSGGNYVFGSISLVSGSQLVSAPGVTTIVWVNSSPTMNSNSWIGAMDQNPQNFFLMCCDTGDINLNASTGFYGFVYAPNANVNIDSSSKVYGGVISKSGTSNSSASVYFPYNNGNCYGPVQGSVTATYTNTPVFTATVIPSSTPTYTATPISCAPGYLNLTSTTKALYLGASSGNANYVYQCNNFDLGTGAMYVDLRGGPVTLYVTGNLTCTASANPSIYMLASPMLNLTGTAQASPPNIFTVYVYGNLVMLSSAGTYNMALSAPSVAVIFYNGPGGPGTFNGAIMAASISNTGGPITFNYPLDIVGRANAYWEPPLVLQGWRKYFGP